jgi:hypothetical protein
MCTRKFTRPLATVHFGNNSVHPLTCIRSHFLSVVARLLAYFDWSEEGGGRGRGPLAAREHPEDRVAEGLAELAVEVGVDERVERRVEVAHPEDHVHHHRRRVRARTAAQVRDVVPQEEG